VKTATTSRDRLLLKLKREFPEWFRKVCENTLTPYAAAIEAGLVVAVQRDSLRFGVCNLGAIQKLADKAKGKLLRKVFRAAGLNAQCTLLKSLELHLGPELAQRWRGAHSSTATADEIPSGS
jgi:hypothetical protein